MARKAPTLREGFGEQLVELGGQSRMPDQGGMDLLQEPELGEAREHVGSLLFFQDQVQLVAQAFTGDFR